MRPRTVRTSLGAAIAAAAATLTAAAPWRLLSRDAIDADVQRDYSPEQLLTVIGGSLLMMLPGNESTCLVTENQGALWRRVPSYQAPCTRTMEGGAAATTRYLSSWAIFGYNEHPDVNCSGTGYVYIVNNGDCRTQDWLRMAERPAWGNGTVRRGFRVMTDQVSRGTEKPA